MKRYLCSLVALGLLQGLGGQVKAQPTYVFTPVDVPGSSYLKRTFATGINTSGQIVGYYLSGGLNVAAYGFLLDQGSYTTLDVPGATGFLDPPPGISGTQANGINDSGQIVGYYTDAQ